MEKIVVWMILGVIVILSAIVILGRRESYGPYCDSKLNTAAVIHSKAYNEVPKLADIDFEHKDIHMEKPDLDDVQGMPNGASEVISSTPAEYEASCKACVPSGKKEFNVEPAEENDNEFEETIDYEISSYGVSCGLSPNKV